MKNFKYALIIHKAKEGGYWATVPELPGCVTEGETLEALRRNAGDAISGILAVMMDRGEELPEPGDMVETVEAKVLAAGA